jgi:hypothetical protein
MQRLHSLIRLATVKIYIDQPGGGDRKGGPLPVGCTFRYRGPVGPPPLPRQVDLLGEVLSRIGAVAGAGRTPCVAFGLGGVLVDERTALAGAVEYVRSCHERGARVVYVGALDAPAMLGGVTGALLGLGFPMAVPGVEVVLKPDANMGDEAFKRGYIPALSRSGEVLAFFDSDAAGCAIAHARFPRAVVTLIEPTASPPPTEPPPGMEHIADFRMA